MKNFIVDEISREDGYEKILSRLEELIKEREQRQRRQEEMMQLTEQLYERFVNKRRYERERLRMNIKCFNCGRMEQTKRWCRFDLGRQGTDGKDKNAYLYNVSNVYYVVV